MSEFNKGDIVVVIVLNCTYPLAIGVADLSSSEIKSSSSNAKGKAITILHYFGDGLWQMGSKFIPPGFGFDQVRPHDVPRLTEDARCPETPPTVVAPQVATSPLDRSIIDKLILVSFFDTARQISDKDTPMNASALFSRIQQSARKILAHASGNFKRQHGIEKIDATNFRLELKASSFVNIKGLITRLSESYLTAKTLKSELIVTQVKTNHPNIANFRPVEMEIPPIASRECLVELLYSLNKEWSAMFPGAPSEPKSNRGTLIRLCNDFMKTHPGNTVQLAHFGGTFAGFKTVEISKREFAQKFADDLVLSHRISTELPPKIHKGSPPIVRIQVKRIQLKKYTTTISGLSKYYLDLSEVARMIASRFSVSSSVDGNDEIFSQGNLLREIKEFLSTVVGIPLDSIR
jgi:translation initiation factor 1 (eIF-1/SUI1)